LLTRLERVLYGRDDERPSSRARASRQKQAQVRLSDEELDIVIAGYKNDLTAKELSSAFGADRRTLANRLQQRGVSRRGRRPSDTEIQEAITLYCQAGHSPASRHDSVSTPRASDTDFANAESRSARAPDIDSQRRADRQFWASAR
jgi:hypothetical protein